MLLFLRVVRSTPQIYSQTSGISFAPSCEGALFLEKNSVISIPAAPESYRGHGSAVSLPSFIVGTKALAVSRFPVILIPMQPELISGMPATHFLT